MANAFENTDLVTRYGVETFLNNLQLAAKVDRQATAQFKKVGSTVEVRRPVYFAATDGAVISAEMDIEEATVPVVLSNRKKVNFIITSQDLTLEVEEFNERYTKPAMEELAQQVESSIAATYTEIPNFVGTPGTTPATFNAVAAAREVLDDLGVPVASEVCGFFTPGAVNALANSLRTVFPTRIAERAIEKAQAGDLANVMVYKNQSLKTHTVGVATGTPLVNGATQNVTYATSKGTDTQTLITDGWTSDTTDILLAGDVITIAGVNSVNQRTREDTGSLQTFTVTADATSGATTGPATITIAPPIITSGAFQTVTAAPADDAVITVKTGTGGTGYRQNLCLHKNCITLAMAALDKPMGGAKSHATSFDGCTIRTVIDYDFTNDTNRVRYDILYGVKVQNRRFGCRVTG